MTRGLQAIARPGTTRCLSDQQSSLSSGGVLTPRSVPGAASGLDAIAPLVEAGFAIHWLHPREKRPIGDDWSTKPVQSLAQLRAGYRVGNNVGVRLGKWSRVVGHYLHVIDLDIRVPGLAAEAKAALASFVPEFDTLPFVVSGSGGESRHFYFLTEKPFPSRKLGHSLEKWTDAKGKEHWAYEIELFGTGKQVAMPPSIHPDTGLPYKWGREIDLRDMDVGIGPVISQTRVAQWAPDATPVGDDEDEEFGALVRARPKDLSPQEIANCLSTLPRAEWCDDREGWLTVGMALHHQFEGRQEGLKAWNAFSAQSKKYDEKDQARVWKSFENSRRPTTMATLLKAAAEAKFRAAGEANFGDDVDLDNENDDDLETDDLDENVLLGVEETRPALDWVSLLDLNEDSAIKATLHNIQLIVANDPRTAGLPQFNEFTQETAVRHLPGILTRRRPRAKNARQLSTRVWTPKNPTSGAMWSDIHTKSIRSIFEAPKSQGGYGIKFAKENTDDAIDLVAHENPFHPVKEYLEGLTWDGIERAETMFIRYLGADETAYSRSISRLTLLGAVTRVYEPGHKFDFVPILEGVQGKRKSTFISILARHWFTEIDGNFNDRKFMVEQMQGSWICEMPELSGFHKHEVAAIKAFVSARVDKVRLSYGRRAQEYFRQCILIGSTNDSAYLRDDTGGRRFWPITCKVDEIDTESFEANVDQIWAEALVLYRAMRAEQSRGTLPLFITDAEAKSDALLRQEQRRVTDAADDHVGPVEEWLDKPEFDPEDDVIDGQPAPPRNIICRLEIWCEMWNEPRSHYGHQQSILIGKILRKLKGWEEIPSEVRTKRYGMQKVFRRKGV